VYSNFSTNGWEWAKLHLESRDKLKDCYNSENNNLECKRIAKELFNKRLLLVSEYNDKNIIRLSI
jgi:hypothetical protein